VSEATLHSVAGLDGVTDAANLLAAHRALVGPFDRIVHHVTADAAVLDEAGRGLPDGAARAEAIAIRLERLGTMVAWGEPDELARPEALIELARARGRSSVEMLRADPTLLTQMQLGAWCQSTVRHRLARRLPLPKRGPALLRAAADRAFWGGARQAATTDEWRRLTASYGALVYHRLAGDGKPGQERIDLDPDRFAAQLRLLRRLGFRPLTPEQLLAFHEDGVSPPRRTFVITVDDGTADCGGPLGVQVGSAPQLYVSTAEVGGSAHWLDGEPLLSWEEVEKLVRKGVRVGAHARTHRPLAGLGPSELEDEVAGSFEDMRARLGDPLPVLAYPNGSHDEAVRAATVSAGFRAAWTTIKGRNGIGTDRWCLRRISVHANDGPIAVLWKVATGETPPWRRR
jgi:peptidoglycan/xylan/chitin deacetylase (PgdA/CDA1 family)